jgi:two-component system NtrC family sensor kinase
MPKAKFRRLSATAPLEILRRFARQSLAVKLVMTTSFVFCLIVLLAAAAMIGMAKKAIAETSVTTALYQTQLLKIKLIESMVDENKRHEGMDEILRNAKSLGQMDEVNIFNSRGEIRFSSVPENVGKTVRAGASPSGRFTPDDAMIQFSHTQKRERLRIVHPIHGGKQCGVCHAEKNQMIGGVELFVPLQPIYRRFSENGISFVLVALAIAFLGAVAIRWLVHHLFGQPIKKMIGVMEKAKSGELDVRTRMHEDPDLRRLSKSFNAMVVGIREAQELVREQHRKELSQSNRLASLGYMISNVSHEIKNPLAAMSSALHALSSDFEARAEQDIFLELKSQITRIEQTVNHLLRYARQAPPRYEKLSSSEIVKGPLEHAIELARHRFAVNHIGVNVDDGHEETEILADSGQLQQIFLNLFLNAASAMPAGGKLSVIFRCLPDAGGGKRLEIEIADTGSGIPPEDMAKIYEPFFTTTEGGTGLGLSVVKGIVEGFGGHMRIESKLGSGTRVFLVFPPAVCERSAEVFSCGRAAR